MRAPTSFQIQHELIKLRGKIPFMKYSSNGREHYNLKIFVDGDLEELASVEYELHPTFTVPNRHIYEARGGFPLVIWTWGEFDIHVTFHYKDGAVGSAVHHLSYSDILPSNPDDYIDISNKRIT